MIKESIQDRAKWTWKRRGAHKVLELTKQGKTVPEIADQVGWKQETVWNFISSPSFLERFNRYLAMASFHYESRKIQILGEAMELLRKRAVETIDELPPAIASRNLMKLLKMRDEPRITNLLGKNFISEESGPENDEDPREYFNLPDLDKVPSD